MMALKCSKSKVCLFHKMLAVGIHKSLLEDDV